MKPFLITLMIFTFSSINAQHMEHDTEPKNTVTELFIATDQRDWKKVENCFANSVLLDYSSMGNPASTLSPKQITDAWKTILPGFVHTHHQIGNIQEEIAKDKASVFAYGTATHYLDDEKGNVWSVVGTYDFDLINEGGHWKISMMKFNFKYQDGNTTLPQKAMDKIAGTESKPPVSERNKNSVRAFLNALETENIDGLVGLFAEEGKHINPYHSGIFPESAHGKEAIRAYWTPVFTNFDGMQFPIEEIYAMEDPNRVYVKFKGNIKLKGNAGYYKNDYYATFTFNNEGKIVEYVEIFNPVTAAKSFGLIDKLK